MIIDCHNHVGVELGQFLRGEFPYGQSLQQMVQEGEALGVDRWIVFGMASHTALNLAALRDYKIEAAGALDEIPYAFENRRLLQELNDLFPQLGRKTKAFALLDPARKQSQQAEVLRQLHHEYSLSGLKIQASRIQAPIKALLKEGRVFLELAAQWDVPILIHSSVLPADIWSQASDIIDIAEAVPGVRFCVAHSCRFERASLERIAALDNCWFDCSAHGIHCQLAAQNSPHIAPIAARFVSEYSDPAKVLHDLATAYPGKLMWGSDSPFYSFVNRDLSLLSSYAREVEYLRALSPELQREIGEANIVQLLGDASF